MEESVENSREETIIPKIFLRTNTDTEGPIEVNCDSAEDIDDSAYNCSLEEDIKIFFNGKVDMKKDIEIVWKPNNSSFFKIKSKIKASNNDQLFRKLVNKIKKNSNEQEIWAEVINHNEQLCIYGSEERESRKNLLKIFKSISHKGSF